MYLHCVLTLLALFGIPVSECLQCLTCPNSNVDKCKKECLDNQSCFVETVHSGNEVLYHMDCQNNQLCSSIRVDHSEIIGRSVQTRQQNRCHECCSTDYCNDENLCAQREVDGQWGSWAAWSLCTSHCDQTRTRVCDNPAPLHGGTDCPGLTTQTQTCNTSSCGAKDCSELLSRGDAKQSGVYTITTPLSHTKILVYCEMETDGGGWTVFQKRFNGSEGFYRNFSDYENGFGSVHAEHWLGLKYIYEITSSGSYQLRVDIVRSNGSKGYDVYGGFSLQPGTNYTLNVGLRVLSNGLIKTEYSFSDGGSSYTPVGNAFSTYDHDVDRNSGGNCAASYKGGWWYNECYHYINLNGLYRPGQDDGTLMNYDSHYGLAASTMMFKSVS